MKARNQAITLVVVVFVIILLMGIYMTVNDYGNYNFILGKYGDENLDGRGLIMIAFTFGGIMLWGFLQEPKK